MSKIYTKLQAYAIWDMSDKLCTVASRFLGEDGWYVRQHYDGDGWYMQIEKTLPDPAGQNLEENEMCYTFSAHIGTDGVATLKQNREEAVMPVIMKLLIESMKPLVGPYLSANSEW